MKSIPTGSCLTCATPTSIFKSSGRPRLFCDRDCVASYGCVEANRMGRSNVSQRACKQCGADFISKRSHQEVCSLKCRWTLNDRRKGVKPFQAAPIHSCKKCGAEFKAKLSKSKGIYCSRTCAYLDIAVWRNVEPKDPKPRISLLVKCCSCERLIAAKTTRCRSCAHTLTVTKALFRFLRSIGESKCLRCDATFPIDRSKFCSLECRRLSSKDARKKARKHPSHLKRKRIWKAKRRAALRGAEELRSVDPIEVYCRDGWKCRACASDTPRHLRGSGDDNEPTLDHVVPVSAGGAHDIENLQTLCRLCNTLKGTMPMEAFVARYFRA